MGPCATGVASGPLRGTGARGDVAPRPACRGDVANRATLSPEQCAWEVSPRATLGLNNLAPQSPAGVVPRWSQRVCPSPRWGRYGRPERDVLALDLGGLGTWCRAAKGWGPPRSLMRAAQERICGLEPVRRTRRPSGAGAGAGAPGPVNARSSEPVHRAWMGGYRTRRCSESTTSAL